jgi:uncharacterized protein (TIGR03066 family)
MKAFSIAAVGFALVLFGSSHAGEKIDTMIIGSWQVVKSEDAPAGSFVEFTKDGRLILIPKGKEDKRVEATYKVDGKKLTTMRNEKGKVEVNILTIQTLSETTLITLNDKGKTDELKRVKAK